MKLSGKQLLIIGIIASVLVGIAEYLLHYIPAGPSGEISMLQDVPLERASRGHFLAVFSAPLYFVGYYGIKKIFQETSPLLAQLIFIAGVLSFSIGSVWLSSRYFAAEVLQRSAGTSDHSFYLNSYEEHYQVLVWALRLLTATISIIYITLIIKNKIGLPKWLAIFNPIFILIVVISTLFWFRPLGNHIAPIAMNVSHLLFFGVLLLQLKKISNR